MSIISKVRTLNEERFWCLGGLDFGLHSLGPIVWRILWCWTKPDWLSHLREKLRKNTRKELCGPVSFTVWDHSEDKRKCIRFKGPFKFRGSQTWRQKLFYDANRIANFVLQFCLAFFAFVMQSRWQIFTGKLSLTAASQRTANSKSGNKIRKIQTKFAKLFWWRHVQFMKFSWKFFA